MPTMLGYQHSSIYLLLCVSFILFIYFHFFYFENVVTRVLDMYTVNYTFEWGLLHWLRRRWHSIRRKLVDQPLMFYFLWFLFFRWSLYCLLPERTEPAVVRVWRPKRHWSIRVLCSKRRGICAVLQVRKSTYASQMFSILALFLTFFKSGLNDMYCVEHSFIIAWFSG